MNEKVSFLSAFFGVCSGVAVFHRLRFQSWGRTIFHVILLAVLASLVITSLPIFILYAAAQKYIVKGFGTAGLKM